MPTSPRPVLLRLAARPLGGIGDAFGDRNFRYYSVGSIVSWLSYFVQAVAVSWTAWQLTHSTRWLAIVALVDALPNIVLAPIGGVIADRYDRFRILLVAYGLATLQAAALAGLAFTGQLTIGHLAGLSFLHGVIHAFSVPAQFGLLPRFVDRSRLASAIAVASAYSQLGIFIGPALAGWVILHLGVAAAFTSNVFGYGVFFASALLMRTPPDYRTPAASGRAFVADLLDGLAAIRAHPGIMGVLGLMLWGDGLSAAVRQMLPAFADKDLGAGIEGLSTLLACLGIGATLAALWLAHGGAARSTSRAILWAFLGFLAGTALLLGTGHMLVAGAAMVLGGFCFETCRTGTVALLQTSVPDRMRGRMMSTQFVLMRLAGALGIAVVGWLGEDWGVRIPLLSVTALALAVWIMTIRRRDRIAAAFAIG